MIRLPSHSGLMERWRASYYCPADFNRDDRIDDQDTADFAQAFFSREGPLAEFLDINHDGFIDELDMDAFLNAPECDPKDTALTRRLLC